MTFFFTLNVALAFFIYKRNQRLSCINAHLSKLDLKIEKVKKVNLQTFRKYQAPTMATSEWHAFNSLVQDISVVGVMDCLSVNVYEGSQMFTKAAFKQTSKQKAAAIDDLISRS